MAKDVIYKSIDRPQLYVKYDPQDVKEIQKALGSLKSKLPKVMSKAANQTAQRSKRILAREAAKRYAGVRQRDITKHMDIHHATVKNPVATIEMNSSPIPLIDFKTRANTKNYGVRAAQLRGSVPKELVKGNIKAFLAVVTSTDKNGNTSSHLGVFQRQGTSRFPIVEKWGSSPTYMIGSDNGAYMRVLPEIATKLSEATNRYVRAVVKGYVK